MTHLLLPILDLTKIFLVNSKVDTCAHISCLSAGTFSSLKPNEKNGKKFKSVNSRLKNDRLPFFRITKSFLKILSHLYQVFSVFLEVQFQKTLFNRSKRKVHFMPILA